MGFERKRNTYLALAGRTFVLLVLVGSGTRALNPQAKRSTTVLGCLCAAKMYVGKCDTPWPETVQLQSPQSSQEIE